MRNSRSCHPTVDRMEVRNLMSLAIEAPGGVFVSVPLVTEPQQVAAEALVVAINQEAAGFGPLAADHTLKGPSDPNFVGLALADLGIANPFAMGVSFQVPMKAPTPPSVPSKPIVTELLPGPYPWLLGNPPPGYNPQTGEIDPPEWGEGGAEGTWLPFQLAPPM